MAPMFVEGLNLMLVGMGVVFAFLAMLVGIVGLMSRLVVRFASEETVPPAPLQRPVTPVAVPGALPDAATLSAIREAVRQHRAHGN
jgi:oxaloacetate decarboxylase gamma subunit